MTAVREPAVTRGLPDHSAFPALDGVRALAVIAVVATHAAFWTGRQRSGAGAALLARLDIGVALFFVLSGFLLMRPWLRAAAVGGARPDVRVYFWRRFLRIMPAYWLAVIAAFVLLAENHAATGADWLRHAVLAQVYHLGWMRDGLTQTWSLSAEVAFYLLLPLFGAAAWAWSRRFGWRPGHLLIGCAGLCLVSVAWYAWLYTTTLPVSSSAIFWLPGYLDWFAAGMALAVVQVHFTTHPDARAARGWRSVQGLADSPGSCWAIAGGLLLIASTPIAGPQGLGLPSAGTAVARNLLYLWIAALVVWPVITGRSVVPQLVFGNRVARWVGEISYSIFLLHLIVLTKVMRLLGYPLFTGSFVNAFVVTLALSIAVSAVSYRLVERPAMRLRVLVRSTTRVPQHRGRPVMQRLPSPVQGHTPPGSTRPPPSVRT